MDARVHPRRMGGLTAWLVCAMAGVLLTGCGGGAPPSMPPSGGPPATSPATATPPAVAGTPSASVPGASSDPTPRTWSASAFGDGWPLIVAGSQDGDPPFVVGADGTAYAWSGKPGESTMLAAVDPAGRMRPGWPFAPPPGTSPATLDVASDASVLAGTFDAERREFTLHRIGPDGREVAGWPFRESSLCPYEHVEVVEAADDTVYVGGCPEDATAVEIAALDPAGRSVDGWPVRID